MSSGIPPSGSRTVPTRARKGSGFSNALKAGAAKTKEPSAKPEKPKKAPQVRIARSTYGGLLATKILKAAGVGLLLIAVIYVGFAVTIVRVLPTTSVGLVPVKNITFPGGLVPSQELVVADMQNRQGTDFTDYFKQSFLLNGNVAEVRVEGGPWGKFQWNDGVVVFEERILNMTMPNEPESNILENSYLVTCLEGACNPGEGYVIHSSQILGQPLLK